MRTATAIAAASALIAAPAAGQDSSTHASRASEHGSAAVADLATAGVQAVGGVVALPLAVVGGASALGGAASVGTGAALSLGGAELNKAAGELASDAWGDPLPVGEAVIVAPEPVPRLTPPEGRARR